MNQTIFTPMQLDAIGEVMNISLGSSATAVSNLLNKRVDITTPKVNIVPVENFSLGDLEPAIGVEIKYVSGLEGSNIMLLKRNDVKVILDILMGTETPDDEFELNELTISAVCEVMNQMMGSASTALSNFLGRSVNISTPQSFTLEDLEAFKEERFRSMASPLVVVDFTLNIESALESTFINVMSMDLARELLAGFGIGLETDGAFAQETDQAELERQAPAPQPEVQSGGKLSQEEIERLMGQMSRGDTQESGNAAKQESEPPVQETIPTPPQTKPAADIRPIRAEPKVIAAQPIQMPSMELAEQLGEEQAANLELILSVPLEVSVEIGRTKRKVEEILTYSKGSLVVLDKLAGDQVDLFVNGMCVARGDVVVVDDNFGIRITEIIKKPGLMDFAAK